MPPREVKIENPSGKAAAVLVDLRIHFVKANGATRVKVFKGGELMLEPGDATTIRKTISLAQHTTRKHYPGLHSVEVQLNGSVHPGGQFHVV